MKTRTGFVSNSSSSSFVILGVKVPEKSRVWDTLVNKFVTEDMLDEYEDEGYVEWDRAPLPDNIERVYDEPDDIFGIVLATAGDCDGMDEGSWSMAELAKMAETIAGHLEIEPHEVKLLTGERPC